MNIEDYLSEGNLEIVQDLYHNKNMRFDIFDEFCRSCLNGYGHQAQWLYELAKMEYTRKKLKIDPYDEDIVPISVSTINELFLMCCEEGNLKMAKWLKNKGAFDFDIGFYLALNHDNVDIACWLYILNSNKMGKKELNILFDKCCRSGNISLTKKIYKKYKNNITISQKLLKNICESFQMDIFKWLITTNKIQTAVLEKIFNFCVSIRNFKIAQLIYSNYTINVSKNRILLTYAHSDNLNDIKKIINKFDDDFEKYKNDYLMHNCGNNNYNNIFWLLNNYKFSKKIIKKSFIILSCKPNKKIITRFLKINKLSEKMYNCAFCNMCIDGNKNEVEWFHDTYIYNLLSSKKYNLVIDSSFEIACRYQNLEVSEWFTKKFDIYYVQKNKDNITSFGKKSIEDYAFFYMNDKNKHEIALSKLNIKKISKINPDKCLICMDICEEMIKLNCGHFGCLKCLLTWFTQKNSDIPAHPMHFINEFVDEDGEIVRFVDIDLHDIDVVNMRMKGINEKELKCVYCQQQIIWKDCFVIKQKN
jgi:hypothetical protein